jgi:hypothetical protein
VSSIAANTFGLAVVEVPLVTEEGGPHPPAASAVRGVDPAERPGRAVGKHVGDRRLVGVGHLPVREGDVEVRVLGLVGEPSLRPGVLAGRVVEHEVHAEAHPALAQGLGGGLEVVHGADARIDRAVVQHGVAAVVLPRAAVGAAA